MTAPQKVFAAASATVAASIVLVAVGVGLVAGLGWALIVAGGLTGPTAAGAATVLLRDSEATG